jgi:Ca2+-binding EF-hand superfamily protein
MSGEHGEFWNRKIRTFFRVIDFDNDGFVTHKDYEAMAQHFIDVGHLDEVKAKQAKRKFMQIWEKFFGVTERTTGPLTMEAFVDCKRRSGLAKLTRAANEIFAALFDLIDLNGDGVIQKDEFEKFYNVVKLDEKAAAETFKAIDTNGDGLLSADEFITAGIDFFNGDDESSPYRFLFGPLVQ